MAFGTYTVVAHKELSDGGKWLFGYVTAAAGDVAFSADLSSYFAKAIKWACLQQVGVEKGIVAVDYTTTPTTLAATLTNPGGVATIQFQAIGH